LVHDSERSLVHDSVRSGDVTDESGTRTDGGVSDLGPEPVAAPEVAAGGGRLPFDLNAQQKRVLLVALVVHVIVARFTLRDLRRRPAPAVRGPKRLWRVWATLNTTGSLAYWLVGRRKGVTAPPVNPG
jgi:hypothetical protein